MVRQIVFAAFLMLPAMGCEDDFRQGSCDEGFYQQNDGNGGFFCAPIAEKEPIDGTVPDADNFYESN